MPRISVVRLAIALCFTGGACAGTTGSNNIDPGGSEGGAAAGSTGTGDQGGSGGAITGTGGSTNGSGGSSVGSGGSTGKGGSQGSPDAGVPGTGGATSSPDAAAWGDANNPPAGYKPSIVVVGWGGVRVSSMDGGRTWGNRAQLATGADEPTLLRAVTYAAGMYVAVGVPIFTSPDGVTWTSRPNPFASQYGTQWLGGVAYGNGLFVAAGGCGVNMRSSDKGATWTKGPELSVGNCMDHMRSVAFGGGQFAAAGDKHIVYVSTDGAKWTVLAGLSTGSVDYCGGAFKDSKACPLVGGPGVFVRAGGGWPRGSIERSVNGTSWQKVHDDANPMTAVAYGYSPP